MICQSCGQNEATVHLVELVDGKRTSQWLCAECAGRPGRDPGSDPGFGFGDGREDREGQEDAFTLASFLGQVFEPQHDPAEVEIPACPSCAYTLEQFRQTNSLGCPRCYEAFRQPLMGILSHLHRHVSHLGKVPGSDPRKTSVSNALARARVALEKAIAGEDFEKAARLRDEIQRLAASGAPEGEREP